MRCANTRNIYLQSDRQTSYGGCVCHKKQQTNALCIENATQPNVNIHSPVRSQPVLYQPKSIVWYIRQNEQSFNDDCSRRPFFFFEMLMKLTPLLSHFFASNIPATKLCIADIFKLTRIMNAVKRTNNEHSWRELEKHFSSRRYNRNYSHQSANTCSDTKKKQKEQTEK